MDKSDQCALLRLLYHCSRREIFLRLQQNSSWTPAARELTGYDKLEQDLGQLADDIQVIDWYSPKFPQLLREIPDPPVALFCQGTQLPPDLAWIGIVGARRASRTGLNFAHHLAEDLSAVGMPIISGLAYGIDAAAHRGALSAGGLTSAVLGGGHDHFYPKMHVSLGAEIVAAGGAILSEYPPSQGVRKHQFPERNRIVSGLCVGIVVVEAGDKSGSLITARLALEQGREVMAVPGSVNNPGAKGCHRLLKQGASMVTSAADVVETLGLQAVIRKRTQLVVTGLSQNQQLILDAMGYEEILADEVAHETKLTTQVVLSQLVQLELKGFVESGPHGYIRRSQ